MKVNSEEGTVRGLLFAAAWCALHLLLFISARHWGTDRRERFAFLFHAASFAVLSTISISMWAIGWVAFPVAIGIMAVHAIYSLTTLELWSLSEGSYSLTMLAETEHKPISERELASRFHALGEQKKASRLHALETANLITVGEDIALTPKGRRVARALEALRTLANFRDAG